MEIQKNFKMREFACKCGCSHESYQVVNILRLSYALQALRDLIGSPIIIHSGYRCPMHNKAVGGASRSFHMHGLAADIRVPDWTPRELHHFIKTEYRERTGFRLHCIEYRSFLHVDLRHDFDNIMNGLYDGLEESLPASGEEILAEYDDDYDIGGQEHEDTVDMIADGADLWYEYEG